MKTLIPAVILAAVTVTGSTLFNIQLDKASHAMEEHEREISAHISRGDFDAALAELNELRDCIDKTHAVLASAVDHKFIDDIELCVAELSGCAEQKNTFSALVKCRKLEQLIRRLPSNYSLTLQNIL